MKKAYTMIALAVLVGSMAVVAQAQAMSHTELRANIPFRFNVGDKTMPAGEYRILSISNDSSTVVVKIEGLENKSSVILQMRATEGRPNESSKLIFNRYGNKCFLAQAWIEGDRQGLSAPSSRAERATRKEMTALGVETERIALSSR